MIIKVFQNELAFFNSMKLKTTNKNFIADNPKIIKTMYFKSLKLVEKADTNIVSKISRLIV